MKKKIIIKAGGRRAFSRTYKFTYIRPINLKKLIKLISREIIIMKKKTKNNELLL